MKRVNYDQQIIALEGVLKTMKNGCTNGNCCVRDNTKSMHTNGWCNCTPKETAKTLQQIAEDVLSATYLEL